MAEDLSIALQSRMSRPGKMSVAISVCWGWTGIDGKYEGCPYWTPRAIAEFDNGHLRGLRHEHAVPRRVFCQIAMDIDNPSPERVFSLCESLLFGVVVTGDEDRLLSQGLRQRMPPEFDDPGSPSFRDPWLRYKLKRIPVVRRTITGSMSAFELPP